MEEVYNPNNTYAPNGQQYPQQQQQYAPVQPPVPQQQYQQPPTPSQPPAQQGWGGQQGGWGGQQAPVQPQQQYQQPPVPQQTYQAPVQSPQPPQPQQASQGGGFYKYPTQKGPMNRRNMVIMDGYFVDPKFVDMANGNVRVNFILVWEMPKWVNGQMVIDPATNLPVTTDVPYNCSAFGRVAEQLRQLPPGTPISVIATLNKWEYVDQQSGQKTVHQDLRVNKFDIM